MLLASETLVQLWTTLAHCCGKPWSSLSPFTCILEVSISRPQETRGAWPKTLTKHKYEVCYTWTYFTSLVSLNLGPKWPIIIYKGGVYDTWGVWDQINQVLFAPFIVFWKWKGLSNEKNRDVANKSQTKYGGEEWDDVIRLVMRSSSWEKLTWCMRERERERERLSDRLHD